MATAEAYWWDDPVSVLTSGRWLRFVPNSLWDFSSSEAVNRWSVYSLYVGVASYLLTGSYWPLVYMAAVWAGLYLWNGGRVRAPVAKTVPPPAVPDPVAATAGKYPKMPDSVLPEGPSRNVATYDERLGAGLMARGAEVPARVPVEASKQRKAFARPMPMTGDEVPFKQVYEQDKRAAWRPRPVG